MNNKIFNSVLTAGLTLALASCGENSWNDHYLDGFEGGANYDTPSSTEGAYTLTDEDYDAISKLMLEQAVTEDETNAAKAIGANHYLDKSSVYPATVVLPHFMATKSFPYYLDPADSKVAVTYNEASEVSPVITAISGGYTYTLSSADYTKVPSDNVAAGIPAILAQQFSDATDGAYAIVSYSNNIDANAANAARSRSINTLADNGFTLSSVLGSLTKGSAVTIDGYVAAISTQGPIVTDAAGSAFVYAPTNNSDLKIGDQLSISSTVDSYNYGFQIARGSTPEVKGSQAVTYPTPRTWTGAEIDKFVSDAMASGANPISPIYSTFKGKAIVSGNYINIELDGTTVQLSPYGATDEVKANITDGFDVEIEGYVMAIASKGKYLNTIVTKATTIVPEVTPDTNAVYCYSNGEWVIADNAMALNLADYEAMGFENNKLDNAATYIPLYLKNKLQYAVSGDEKYVVYNGNKCGLFVYNGSSWTLNDNSLETVTARYTKGSDSWSFTKYLGKAVYREFNQPTLLLDRSYLFACGNQAATPVAAGKTYGYLTAVPVSVKDGIVEMENDAYAFTAASSYLPKDATEPIECPEGKFLLYDSSNRYFYLTGSFNSPNFSSSPVINDGVIDETYLFSATNNGDGTWSITRGEQTMRLSTSHGSYGFYTPMNTGEGMLLPSLYLLD